MPNRLFKRFSIGLLGAIVMVVGVSLFTTATARTNAYYSVTELGTLNRFNPFDRDYPEYSAVYSINDLGQAVGESTIPRYSVGIPADEKAVSWRNDGRITEVSNPGFGGRSVATGINNSGQVVGYVYGISFGVFAQPVAVLWQNAQSTQLTTSTSTAKGINNVGQVILGGAVLWNKGQLITLGTLNGYAGSAANGINDAGQVVGYSVRSVSSPTTSSLLSRGVLWQNRVPIDLGTLGGTCTSSGKPNTILARCEATSINNAGQIVGTSQTSNGQFHAFLRRNGSMGDLGTLGGKNSSALGINNGGIVVGTSETSTGESHAFVWYQGRMIDLNSLLPPNSGWVLNSATAINNKGVIVGNGIHNGKRRAFLLR
jgi:probable HAF family extracellular repeat protein